MSDQIETYQLSQIQIAEQTLIEIQKTNKLLETLIGLTDKSNDLLDGMQKDVDHLAWTKSFDD